jgi:hypothetical protein
VGIPGGGSYDGTAVTGGLTLVDADHVPATVEVQSLECFQRVAIVDGDGALDIGGEHLVLLSALD